mmetsp:Transcript_137805/g.384242  ORF Transcript_137805/g.384242 Transcript_137805/m.384242 type:complete len:213 (+) Transcript_137805:814-1452(+)
MRVEVPVQVGALVLLALSSPLHWWYWPGLDLLQALVRRRQHDLRLALAEVLLDQVALQALRALERLLALRVTVVGCVLLPHLVEVILPAQALHSLGSLRLQPALVRPSAAQAADATQALVEQLVQGLGKKLRAEGLLVVLVLRRGLAGLQQGLSAAGAPNLRGLRAQAGHEVVDGITMVVTVSGWLLGKFARRLVPGVAAAACWNVQRLIAA